MYDELIEQLRETSIDFGESDYVSVMLIEAANAIEDLITALTASNEVIAKNKTKWIPVTERLPKNHQHCLVFTDTHRMGYFAKNLEKVDEYDFKGEKHHGWYYLDSEWGYCEIRNVTYWMPLPQPPEDK